MAKKKAQKQKASKNIFPGQKMKVTMLLADSAQSVGGKLYILGGGWSVIGPDPAQSAIAIKIEVPWNQTNHEHELKLELLDGDFKPVEVPTPAGNAPLVLGGKFEVGRPPGLLAGTSMDVPVAFNIAPIPLQPGQRFIWKLTIDGIEDENWQVRFQTRPARKSIK